MTFWCSRGGSAAYEGFSPRLRSHVSPPCRRRRPGWCGAPRHFGAPLRALSYWDALAVLGCGSQILQIHGHTRTHTRTHIVKCDANKTLIPAQDCVFITCNAGKSRWGRGPPAGITGWWGEAAAKGVASHQMTRAVRDAAILLGGEQHLHPGREICRGNQERSACWGATSSRLKTSVCLLPADSPSLCSSGKSDFYLNPRGAEEKKKKIPWPPAAHHKDVPQT